MTYGHSTRVSGATGGEVSHAAVNPSARPCEGRPSGIAVKSGDGTRSRPRRATILRGEAKRIGPSFVFAEAVRERKKERERNEHASQRNASKEERKEEREGQRAKQRNTERDRRRVSRRICATEGEHEDDDTQRRWRKPRTCGVVLVRSSLPHLQSIPTRTGPARGDGDARVPYSA